MGFCTWSLHLSDVYHKQSCVRVCHLQVMLPRDKLVNLISWLPKGINIKIR